MIRRHHPLLDQDLEVLSANRSVVVVRLANSSSLKIPRPWTDADGAQSGPELQGESKLSVQGLRELLELLESLRNGSRRCES